MDMTLFILAYIINANIIFSLLICYKIIFMFFLKVTNFGKLYTVENSIHLLSSYFSFCFPKWELRDMYIYFSLVRLKRPVLACYLSRSLTTSGGICLPPPLKKIFGSVTALCGVAISVICFRVYYIKWNRHHFLVKNNSYWNIDEWIKSNLITSNHKH